MARTPWTQTALGFIDWEFTSGWYAIRMIGGWLAFWGVGAVGAWRVNPLATIGMLAVGLAPFALWPLFAARNRRRALEERRRLTHPMDLAGD